MPLDPSRIQAICFDVDGTLRDTDYQYALRFERMIRPLRFLLPGRDERHFARRFVMWAEGPGNALLGVPDQLHLDDGLARFTDWLHHRLPRRKQHEFILIPGTVEMLESLKGRYKLAVVSARSKRGTMAFLDGFGLTPFFDAIATAQTTVRTKPFPDPVIWAAEAMGVAPADCVRVGDTLVDLRAGRAAGAQTVGVLCGFGEREELHSAGPDEILASTPELAGLLN